MQAACVDPYAAFVECADPTGCGTGNDDKAWDLQMCTDVAYEVTTNNVSDMFPPSNWSLAARAQSAAREGTVQLGLLPREGPVLQLAAAHALADAAHTTCTRQWVLRRTK